jgi:mannosyl-oligosaccharide alpha-1,2-mannosidase
MQTPNLVKDSLSEDGKERASVMGTKQYKPNLYQRKFPSVSADLPKQQAIKEAFLHAWRNYESYCYGSDAFHPKSRTCSNGNLAGGLTIIDAISTMALMNLTEDIEKAARFVEENFAPGGRWSLFEFVIRYLGGLISAGDVTGKKVFTDTAIKLGYAILPIMEATGGIIGTSFQIRKQLNGEFVASGGYGGGCLAEWGTYQVEFLSLARLTGDVRFVNAAIAPYKSFWPKHRNAGVVGHHIGACEDSYYEYIIKSYLLTGGCSEKILEKHLMVVRDIKEKLLFKTIHNKLVGIGLANTGGSIQPEMEHLATFAGGMITIGTVKGNPKAGEDLDLAGELARTFAKVYTETSSGVMAERVMYNVDRPDNPADFWGLVNQYILRPESVESVYYMWKFTGDQKYRDWAWEMWKGINRSCRSQHGYTSIFWDENGKQPTQIDEMESFFLAETLKYLYLTFSDSDLVSLNDWVFNTEAHPVKVWDWDTIEKFRDIMSFRDLQPQGPDEKQKEHLRSGNTL